MSRVDFYLLSSESGIDKFACIMASKAWTAGNNVYIHTDSEDTTKKLDDMLWTFRDISFIPHEIYNGNENIESPVTIGFGNLLKISNLESQLQIIRKALIMHQQKF